jgi:hypothetical protein
MMIAAAKARVIYRKQHLLDAVVYEYTVGEHGYPVIAYHNVLRVPSPM